MSNVQRFWAGTLHSVEPRAGCSLYVKDQVVFASDYDALAARLAEAESRQTCEGTKPYVCHALATARARLAEAERVIETAVGANAMWKRLHDETQVRLAEAEAAWDAQQDERSGLYKRLADLEAERALIIQRAENAEAALVEAEARADKDVIVRNRVITETSARLAETERHRTNAYGDLLDAKARLAEAESLFDADIVEIIYGPPCAEYEADCACCRAWRWLDGRNEHP